MDWKEIKQRLNAPIELMDDKGRLWFFGLRISIIDFLVFIVLPVLLLPMGYFAYIISTRPKPTIVELTHYEITYPCPICGNSIIIDTVKGEVQGIPKGEPLPPFYDIVCKRCGNKVVLIDKTPPPPPSPPNWTLMLHKLEYEEKVSEKDNN